MGKLNKAIMCAIFGLGLAGTGMYYFSKPTRVVQSTPAKQINLWEEPKKPALDEVKSFFEEDKTPDKTTIAQINVWLKNLEPGNYQLSGGETPARVAQNDALEFSNHKKISGRTVSLIKNPSCLENYVRGSSQRIDEFREWLENKGLTIPEVVFEIPTNSDDLVFVPYNPKLVKMFVVNTMHSYEYYQAEMTKNTNGKNKKFLKEVTIETDKAINGEVFTTLVFDYDMERINGARVELYFSHLQVPENELEGFYAELCEPLHYQLLSARCRFFEFYVNQMGNKNKSFYNYADVNNVQNNLAEAEEGFVHAVVLHYLNAVKGINVEKKIEFYTNRDSSTKMKGIYKAVLPALQIIERKGIEKSIEDYLESPEDFYNN
ncbi:hypothetical protein HZA97_06625 [Candidatus Woesearchaeota archaeon]|nr:hypothetical protein [Candidatus Woesearchaeota archaeon]